MTNKILLLGLVIFIAFGISACGKKGDVNPPKSNSTVEAG